ncbi:DNA primase [Fulvivirga imtechensis AK7]|uniref:DNA primase n=1 Tax=Fulvivirga imtechensis AK7 TaxID=1237149 RepID=L8JL19_9BACT|nr:toprim domain-containing protein [Fulvivirga imtechensis]ELR68189.1 DNA primase [Fulvivirga imtechensis AK7]
MEIPALKNQLDIYQVAERLGIRINKHHKALCPFHDDKRPSLQFSKEKQIATCFSGHCTAGTMDVISLVAKKLNLSTHEAIKWLETEFNPHGSSPPAGRETSKAEAPNFPQLFRVFEGNLKKSSKGKAYLEKRGLSQSLEVGYNGKEGWEKMRNCLIFPLKDEKGQIVSFYGRRAASGTNGTHYYNTNRQGLYPGYPKASTETLILTESVIDAATLQQHIPYPVLAFYGVNGITKELAESIKKLEGTLKELIFFFDGDEAGRSAVEKHAAFFEEIMEVKVSYVETPEGEDINSLAVNHPSLSRTCSGREEKELFTHLINNRKPFHYSPDPSPVQSSQANPSQLITDNPELLYYQNCVLNFTVLGGIKITGLDRLRVTLKIEHTDKNHLLPIRHNLDLYNNGQVEQLGQKIAEQMEVTTHEAVTAMAHLINELEEYREKRLEALKPKKETKPVLNQIEKTQALEVLKSPDLMKETMNLITQSGIVGEERNAFIAYLTYTSRKRASPLHLMCLGASGTGKTYLQEKVGELMPEEDKLEITTLSENAFYYFGREELKHKLILIEDLDGLSRSEASGSGAAYALRELQSKRRISKTVTLKDNKGNLKTVTLKVEGPVCVSGCTTREKIYEDNANRCILVYIDTSTAQDKKIMAYQQAVSSGSIDKTKENQNKQCLKNMQRLLKPLQIRNPYASMIQLPESVFKPRRTMMLLLSFIETITYYHQYQRSVSTDRHTGEQYIQTEVEDIAWAFRLLKEALFAKSDELSGACRSFFEQLKSIKGEESFRSQEIRKALRLAPSTLKRYLLELTRYGYVKVAGGSKYRGFEYQVSDHKEYEALRSSIDEQLEAILTRIRSVGK